MTTNDINLFSLSCICGENLIYNDTIKLIEELRQKHLKIDEQRASNEVELIDKINKIIKVTTIEKQRKSYSIQDIHDIFECKKSPNVLSRDNSVKMSKNSSHSTIFGLNKSVNESIVNSVPLESKHEHKRCTFKTCRPKKCNHLHSNNIKSFNYDESDEDKEFDVRDHITHLIINSSTFHRVPGIEN